MAITLDGLSRPKAATEQTLSLTLFIGTATEYDAVGNGREGVFTPFKLSNIDPSQFAVTSCTTTSGSARITTGGSAFSNVFVGDPVSGTGIPANSTVIAKIDGGTIDISANATASGTVTLNFDPAALDPTLFALGTDIIKQGSNLVVKVTAYQYDGSLKGAAGTDTNATSTRELGSFTINADEFLSNCRVARQN